MRRLDFVLACLACASHARQANVATQVQRSSFAKLVLPARKASLRLRRPLRAFSSLLLPSYPVAAFETTIPERSAWGGKCFCGSVRVKAVGLPTAVSICHCVICRKLSGAPFMAQALLKSTQVTIDSDKELQGYETSAAVKRYRCPDCASPIYATLGKGKMAAVPLTMLEPLAELEGKSARLLPTHHMYYTQRILDVNDDLPKYRTSSRAGGELWTGD